MPPADYTGAARDGEGDGNLMGKGRNQHPQQLQDNIFAGNLFFDDLLAWRHSPEGEQFAEFSDTLCDVMEDVQLDARKRQFIWLMADGSISFNPSRASTSDIPTCAVTGSRNICSTGSRWTTLQNTTQRHNSTSLTGSPRNGLPTISAAPRRRRASAELVTHESSSVFFLIAL